MTDIPDWAFEEADKHFIPVQTEVTVAAVREVVARAIMAATERAALIAQGWKPPKQDITEPTKLYRPFDVSDAIAAAIRNGAQPSNVIPIIGTIGK